MTGIDEGVWLQEFMAVRRSVLLNPDNTDTQEEWSESVGRVDTLIDLYRSGNLQLTTPVRINPWGNETDHIIPAEYE
jgi:chitosanase